jgi:L-ribulose-5-phosphate 4-epimerase
MPRPAWVRRGPALEVIAEMALKALQLNPNAPPIPQALLDKHFLRKHGAAAYYGQA